MDAHDVLHGPWLTFVIVENGAEVVNRAQAVATKLEVISHNTCSGISKVEGCFLVKGVPRVSIGDDHI